MKQQNANDLFQEADEAFRLKDYHLAIALLNELESDFPANHRVLNAKARTLSHLGRYEEALDVCDRLLNEFDYQKIRGFRDRVATQASRKQWLEDAVEKKESPPAPFVDTPEPEIVLPAPAEDRGAALPAMAILQTAGLLIIIVATGMQYIPWWLGVGIVAGYSITRLLISNLLVRLFMIPFNAKGKALAHAKAQVHAVVPGEPPRGSVSRESIQWVWIDLSITPKPHARGFVHWEPGELAMAPASSKIRRAQDLEKCIPVEQVVLIEDDGKEVPDEGYKLHGPQRLKLLVGLQERVGRFQFVYYTEAFGEVTVDF